MQDNLLAKWGLKDDCGKVGRFDKMVAYNAPEKIVRQDVDFDKWPSMVWKV